MTQEGAVLMQYRKKPLLYILSVLLLCLSFLGPIVSPSGRSPKKVFPRSSFLTDNRAVIDTYFSELHRLRSSCGLILPSERRLTAKSDGFSPSTPLFCLCALTLLATHHRRFFPLCHNCYFAGQLIANYLHHSDGKKRT